ncbi:MAG: TonB-dependent receptor, partial [Bacteroidetes bacterium 4484_249]
MTTFVLFAHAIYAQTGVKGVIKDSQTNETLIGATILLEGTSIGAATDIDGKFKIDAPAGSYKLDITYVGYDKIIIDITIEAGKYKNIGAVKLDANAIGLGGVSIIADRAKERETPVAFSNIDKKDIEEKLGSRDIPMVMNITPSVYATQQGGGAGDARINVRGFNQRNVAIMINGVPINDMENGWVYWSNWDGIADATSSIQMQRGLSAVNLATPSIGGTMNVITAPAEMKAGGSAKFEVGSGNFYKLSLSGNSGLINEKFAVSVSAVRKVGEGVIDKTWTDAWAYYIGASY